MYKQIHKHFRVKTANLFYVSSIFLAGFGIYIGRILRWNSWDIIANPTKIMSDLFHIITSPIEQHQAWTISLGFSLLILVSNKLIKVKY